MHIPGYVYVLYLHIHVHAWYCIHYMYTCTLSLYMNIICMHTTIHACSSVVSFHNLYSTMVYTCYVICIPYFSQTVGVTTTLPDNVPDILPVCDGAGGHEWNYEDRSLYHNGSSSEFPNLPSLKDLTTNQSVGLLVTTGGHLHLYVDGRHVQEVATGLPVHKPLWGAIDVYSNCTKIKSEILSGEFE